MKYPWMPLFWGDFLANTMHLSAQEAGAYLFLIAHAWESSGEIPGDRVRLARIAHVRQDQWKKVWSVLQDFFELRTGGLLIGRPTDQWYIHRRVTDELYRLGKISQYRKAAAQQKHSKSYAGASPSASQNEPTKSISKTKGESLSNGKQGDTEFRDKGPSYRAPPLSKSENVLVPIPDNRNRATKIE